MIAERNIAVAWRRTVAGLILFVVCLAAAPLAPAQNASTNSINAPAFDVEKATRAYLDRMTPEKRARSNAYFEGGYWLRLWDFLYGACVALFLLQTRLSAWMRDLSRRVTRVTAIHTAGYWCLYVLVSAALTFPLTVYEEFFREHRYGLASQDFAGWFGDFLKNQLVMIVLGGLLVTPLLAIIRRRRGQLDWIGPTVAIAFLVFVMIITPVFINPLFNNYTPLSDAKVVQPILRLARANGIAVDKVFQMDASRQTTRISANVSGLLGTTRITLNDNLLDRCSLPEIEAVMGHEMGHYVLNHIYKFVIFFGIVIVVGMKLGRWAVEGLVARFGGRWGITAIGDPAAIPLVMFLISAYQFVLTPALNTFIRVQEVEADIFSLNASRQPDGFAEVSLKLAEYRKMEPGPVEEFIFYDHPSGAARIRAAMRWKAEQLVATPPVSPP